eukprot:436964_1
MYNSLISIYICLISQIHSIRTPITRTIPHIESAGCSDTITECSLQSPYVIRQLPNQSVLSWDEGRDLCLNPNDDEVDGMATLDVSSKAIIDTPLDDQFDLLRAACRTHPPNNDGRNVNCWVGGKLNDTKTGYIFSSMDTNHLDYHIKNGDTTRWACIKNNDGTCRTDQIEGELDNDQDYICLFNSREYYFADWPRHGGDVADFQVTAVVCNSNHFSYIDRCQCECETCDIYGDPYINTFDGVIYHLKGTCVYETVTPCNMILDEDGTYKKQFNEDFPIEITTENVECFNGFSSCLNAVYVSLYNTSGVLQTMIKFGHKINNNKEIIETTVTFEKEGQLQLEGTVDLNISQPWIDTPPDDNEPWSFLLTKNNNDYILGIWTHTKYQTARIEFRDLSGLKYTEIHLASSQITLSSCFAGKTCGICGYYDGDENNELLIRDYNSNQLIKIPITDQDISDPFEDDADEIISRFSDAWIDYSKTKFIEECSDIETENDLCEIKYCDDNCICDDTTNKKTTYNGMKQIQCNYNLAVCLANIGISGDACNEWENYNQQQQTNYLLENAPHCAELVDHFCCYGHGIFCPTIPNFCTYESKNPTHTPSVEPTPGPTREPTDKPSELPTISPTTGPTDYPTTAQPTTSPVRNNLCLPSQASNIDIVFLVDNSCGLSQDQCNNQQDGISEFLASIKGSSDPRIAYITFGDTQTLDTKIHLINDDYNNIEDNIKGEENRLRFIEEIRDYYCGPLIGLYNTDLIAGIESAINELKFSVNPNTINRDRKIVIFSNCEHNSDTINVCDLMNNDELIIANKPVEITVVNIRAKNSQQPGFKANTYLRCLTYNEPERFIALQDTKLSSFDANINQFITAVCENDTPSPTHEPSPHPTPNPTMNPVTLPTVRNNPTASPLEDTCEFEGDADILFIVDTTCGLDDNTCIIKRKFISDLVQSIKKSHNPRVGMLECGQGFNTHYSIHLSDNAFNYINDNNELSKSVRDELYFVKIETRLRCLPGTGIPKKSCLSNAVDILNSDSIDDERIRKIVYIQICPHTRRQSVCGMKDEIFNNKIEIILVNIGDQITDAENDCIFNDKGPYGLYRFDNFDFKTQEAMEIKQRLISHLCSSNQFLIKPVSGTISPTINSFTTKAPTDNPTNAPTDRPTVKPTDKPTTKTPTKCVPTNKPTNRGRKRRNKRKWSQSDDSSDDVSDPCDDFDGSDSSDSAPKPTTKPINGRWPRWTTKTPTWKTPTKKPTWPTKKPTW